MNVKQGSQAVGVRNETKLNGWFKSGAVLLLAWAAALTSAQSSIIISDNFDSEIAGAAPANWISSLATINNTQSVSAPNSLAIVDPGYAYRNLPSAVPLSSNLEFQVSYDFMASTISNLSLNRFLLFNDVPNHYGALGSVRFYDGSIRVLSGNGSTDITLASYTANTWYHVTINFTPSDGFFDVLVTQGVTTVGSASGVSFNLGSNPNLDANPVFDTVSMSNEFSVGTATSFFDNIVVQTVPEPSSALLCAAAGGLLLCKRRKSGRIA